MAKSVVQDTANTTINPAITMAGGRNDTAIQAIVSVHAVLGAPSAADGGAGNIGAGTYVWAVTQVNAEGENSIGVKSNSQILGASHQGSLTAIPLGPTGTTSRKVYRSADAGATWALVGTIANNTTTTFADNLATATTAPPAMQAYSLAVAFTGGAASNTDAPALLHALGCHPQRNDRHAYDGYRRLDI